MKKRILPLIMAGCMAMSAGCGGTQTTVSDATESGTETAVTETTESKPEEEKELVYKPFVIGTEFDGDYNPFFSVSEGADILNELLNVRLLENDRRGAIIYKGIEGESRNYNGIDYSYSGIADCEVKEAEDGSVTYGFTLKSDVCFSDGEKLTADDLIFTYYVYCDPSYDGAAGVAELPIKGLEAYRNGSKTLLDLLVEKGEENTDFELFSESEQKNFFEKDLPAAGAEFAQSIADNCIEKGFVTEIEKIDSNPIANAMANWGYAAVNDDESITAYYSKTHWTLDGSDGPDAADFFNEMMLNYKGNIRKLSDSEKAGADLTDFLPVKYRNTIVTGDSAESIEGIVKKSDSSVEITLEKADASDLYKLNCYILPLHFYGSDSDFNGTTKFGFDKGDLSAIREAKEHAGAGPYTLSSFEDGVYSLAANETYYKGKPLIEEIQLCGLSEDERLTAVSDGCVDAVCCGADKAVMEEVKKANAGDTESAYKLKVVMEDAASYGYIGMNVQRVKVGADPLSEESCYLRKALATVLSVYREDAVRAYYGESARVTEYPVSDINSLITGDDPGYRAYSTDSSGKELYTENMNEDNRTEAALRAALKYFELAGYSVNDGKLTAVPMAGGSLMFEALISGGGEGDHPSMYILTKAAEALNTIGFELKVTDLDDPYRLWTNIEGGKADLWCAAWPSGIYPDMFDVYHSEGRSAYMYRLYDKELDGLINEAALETDPVKRNTVYKNCLDHIIGLAVEVPVYRRQGCSLFSVEKVEIESLPADLTPYYDYLREIESLQIKPSAL
ncbi:MAG: ABC transporter substrate-binding protein [Lachnospiraceae bacterium]|nr:ABC transporter substrate-binding protein [Lachnospiraceae bacterium]